MAHGFYHPTATPASGSDAHGMRAFRDAMTRVHPGAAVVPVISIDDELVHIIAALNVAPMKSFDISTAAVVSGSFVEGRISIRLNGQSWLLSPLSCSVLSLLVRLELDLRGHDLFADAFSAAVTEAGAKVDAVNTWSGRIRPTDGDEG